ncbi:MBL fold metallo-hydrolase [Desertivirga xinjiangensis]|uniref:MBL fold metallo-hydrolase n=1 Tax=Desertivirga xinjiangensis TaxID=539206 RepID=UPI002109B482|nr:MBL fold metallo-hydrolase [Pedobacter xinjiangensis]
MSLLIASLNSGSNGNCYYIGNESEAILVDAGISCRETEKRMKRLGLCMSKVKAIVVSHEHSDHIRGIATLAKKHRLPVYITERTYLNGGLSIDKELLRSFEAYQNIRVGQLKISAFPKFHDAADPHSFIIAFNDIKVGVFTDIGSPCEHLIDHFQQCHAAFLEANYDEEMLENGRYPWFLKRRISGGHGHLSNAQALKLFKDYKPQHMSHLLLSHLSKDNNCPQLVYELFSRCADHTKVIVASRYEETEVYHIGEPGKRRERQIAGVQTALF